MNSVTASAPHPAAMQHNHAPNGADSRNPMYVLRVREFDILDHRKCIRVIKRECFALLVQQTPNFAQRVVRFQGWDLRRHIISGIKAGPGYEAYVSQIFC